MEAEPEEARGSLFPTEKRLFSTVCDQFSDVFGPPGEPKERAIKHRIDLVDPKQPVYHHRQYRMS